MRIDGKKETARQAMSWLHGWLGILAGCLLYVIFCTGSLSFYQKHLNLWLQPELHQSLPYSTEQQQLDFALAYLSRTAPHAGTWQIKLANTAQPTINVSTLAYGQHLTGLEKPKQTFLDASTGQKLTTKNTAGAEFISVLHFQLYGLPHSLGRWIVGIATLFMLVALISGIVIHKKIFKEFFVFRRGKGLRSWLDGHNITAIYSIPFQLMISFSGLLLLVYTLMPWTIERSYPQGKSQFITALQLEQLVNPSPLAIPLVQSQGQSGYSLFASAQPAFNMRSDLRPLLSTVQKQWKDNPVAMVIIEHPNTAQAQVEFRAKYSDRLSRLKAAPHLKFNLITGQPIQTALQAPVATSIYNLMLALHRASGSDMVLRALLFFSGLMGLVMIASGQVLWVVKKQGMNKANNSPWGLKLMQCCNVAVIVGLVLACLSYLYAARLIPDATVDRRDLEIYTFFSTWLFSFIHAALRTHRQAWLEQLALLAGLFVLLPVLNALTGGMPLWESLSLGQTAVAAIDIGAMIFACIVMFIFYHIKNNQKTVQLKAKRHLNTSTPAKTIVKEQA